MALDAIIAYKKELLDKKVSQLEGLRSHVVKSDRSLYAALRAAQPSFIFEIKPASPSKGIIRPHADIASIAKIYAPFASAISVLADEKFFGGSLENVQSVAKQVACPILAKDVVVSPHQIIEARAFGAHAVLLMLSVLDDKTYEACAKTAHELGMDFITEVHDEAEMARANRFLAPIIGINNRNLRTLSIDLQTTNRLAPRAHKDAYVISESGISLRSQLQSLGANVDGFLIGTALMQAERIDLALRELLFGRVKICGLTNREDAQAAYNAGAYYGGLNFFSKSKRVVTPDEAREIIKDIPLVFGGVFVNQSVDEVSEIATSLKLAFVQIHGDEPREYLADLRKRLRPQTEMWRALRMKDSHNIAPDVEADRVVLDAYQEGNYGGTGLAFDWSGLRDCQPGQYILAGGINSENIRRADGYAPFAIDIASGVEDGEPRKKSHALIRELFSHLLPRGRS